MINLVTLEECYAQIRMDSDEGADDFWLGMAIPAASGAVASWLKDSWRLYEADVDTDGDVVTDTDGYPVAALDDDGEKIVLPTVKLAVLVEIASQYRFREGEGDNVVPSDAGHGYTLSKGATALLSSLRKSTLA